MKGNIFNIDNLHLTLHFLANVSNETCDCMSAVASNIAFEPFNLKLDVFGVFKKPKVFWMGVTDTPQALRLLYDGLGFKLADCGYQMEKRLFTPHVTLMRKIKQFDVEEKPQPINWHINRFALVESISTNDGVMYKPIKFYNL